MQQYKSFENSPEDHIGSMAGMAYSMSYTILTKESHLGSWIIDSGASDQMCFQSHLMHNLTKLPQSVKLAMPTGRTIDVD